MLIETAAEKIFWQNRLKFRTTCMWMDGAMSTITSERKRKKERKERKEIEKKRGEGPTAGLPGHHGHHPSPSPRAVAHHSVVPQRGNNERSVFSVWTYARRNRIGNQVRRTRLIARGRIMCRAVGRGASTGSGLFPPPSRLRSDAVTDAVTDALFLMTMPMSI